MVVRLPYVWGPGETLTPLLVDAIRRGWFVWFGQGRHLVSTCHVDNASAGILAAAARGIGGRIYQLTDGEPVVLREFIEAHLAACAIPAPTRSLPSALGITVADLCGAALRLVPACDGFLATPSIVRYLAQEVTIDDRDARHELGYRPRVTWSPDRVRASSRAAAAAISSTEASA
jgi:nucleoside-diphosphate-sugar epimerase